MPKIHPKPKRNNHGYLQLPSYAIFSLRNLLLSISSHIHFNLKNIGRQHGSLKITAFRDATISSSGLQLTTADKSGDMLQKADGSESFADGLTFFLADPTGSNITAGGAMGLPINPTTIAPTNPFVAIKFDTFQNVGWDPVNISPVTHVGIDVNSLTSNVTAVWYCNVTGGIQNDAWIRYESISHKLSVVFTGSTNTTRVKDTIHLTVDLRDYLPEWVTFGFSAATGALFEKYIVKSWEFSSSLYV